MINRSRIDRLKSGVAQIAREIPHALPGPVRQRLDDALALAARRRRLLAAPLIIAIHIAVLAGLALAPPRPPANSLIFIDLSPMPGADMGSSIDGAPLPPKSDPKPDASNVEDGAATEADPSAKAQETATTSAPAIEPPTELPDSLAAEAGAAPEPSPTSADVLAMVEKITGADATAVAQPAVPMTAGSTDRLAEIREQQRARDARRGGGCAIDVELKKGLTADPVAQAALAAIPSGDKSVSNALQLWDGQWTSRPQIGGTDPLAAIRERIFAVVDAAPASCRNALMQGPRFLIVPVGQGPDMVLVIGSGDWRWRDVLPPRPPGIFRWLGLKG